MGKIALLYKDKFHHFPFFCIMENLSKFYKEYMDHPSLTNTCHFETLLWSIKIMQKSTTTKKQNNKGKHQ